MRRALGVLAVVLLCGAEARSEGWPSWGRLSVRWGNHHWDRQPGMGCVDDHPLMPELTHWTLQRSQCKQDICGRSRCRGCSDSGPISYPPLPYGNRAVYVEPTVSPWGAGQAMP